ncbi:MAG: transporter substrate-binding domain-containing protein [Clostridia bacterium]|nr:transporter substrate-binding domain-containing protein [Clostridia bacterium]
MYSGYQEGEGDSPKSGYGYEYLQQIAYYAGWEYEYVNGTFSQLLEMLKNGDIDIMGDLSYTDERAQYIDFANEEQGREYYYLFVREDRTDITATDLSTLQNARVGINKGSVQVDLFQEWFFLSFWFLQLSWR